MGIFEKNIAGASNPTTQAADAAMSPANENIFMRVVKAPLRLALNILDTPFKIIGSMFGAAADWGWKGGVAGAIGNTILGFSKGERGTDLLDNAAGGAVAGIGTAAVLAAGTTGVATTVKEIGDLLPAGGRADIAAASVSKVEAPAQTPAPVASAETETPQIS